MSKNIPDKQWLLGVLGTIRADHEVFHKSYRPPTKKKAEHQQFMIPNNGGFFDNLPQLSNKEMKRGGGVNFMTKKERLQL